jgi:hypothetical protein
LWVVSRELDEVQWRAHEHTIRPQPHSRCFVATADVVASRSRSQGPAERNEPAFDAVLVFRPAADVVTPSRD